MLSILNKLIQLAFAVFTMGELKLTGNSLKGSRPLLSFDETFNAYPQYSLLKELFIQVPTIQILISFVFEILFYVLFSFEIY